MAANNPDRIAQFLEARQLVFGASDFAGQHSHSWDYLPGYAPFGKRGDLADELLQRLSCVG